MTRIRYDRRVVNSPADELVLVPEHSSSSIGSAMNFTWAIRTARGSHRLGAWVVVLMVAMVAHGAPRARGRNPRAGC